METLITVYGALVINKWRVFRYFLHLVLTAIINVMMTLLTLIDHSVRELEFIVTFQ